MSYSSIPLDSFKDTFSTAIGTPFLISPQTPTLIALI